MKFPKTSRPVVIATKGLPFTNRPRLSVRMARWVKCPIFSMHSVLKSLSEENGYDNPDVLPSKAEAERLYRHAFSILCAMAKTNLYCFKNDHASQPNCVIIESPLSDKFQLEQLLHHFVDTWIIIIECRVTNKHRWRMRYFEKRRHASSPRDYELFGEETRSTRMWFASRNWEDAERAFAEYDADAWDHYFHLKRSKNPYLRRLVLDPKRDLIFSELESRERRTSPFVEALTCILTSGKAQFDIMLGQWWKQQMERKLRLHVSPDKKKSKLCKNGDCLFEYEDHLDPKAMCMACDKEITHQAYTCHFCTLALHKSCAELPGHEPEFLYDDSKFDNKFIESLPGKHACESCKVFSSSCTSCVLKTHLKCRLIPTILNDDYHEHILSIRLAPDFSIEHRRYTCQACGEDGGRCSYFCVFCRYDCHVRCATSPRGLEHEHGGYNHFMKLKSSREEEEEEEDYWCNVCFKDMDPECWFYSCQQCPHYVAHLHCVFVKPEHKIYLPRPGHKTHPPHGPHPRRASDVCTIL